MNISPRSLKRENRIKKLSSWQFLKCILSVVLKVPLFQSFADSVEGFQWVFGFLPFGDLLKAWLTVVD